MSKINNISRFHLWVHGIMTLVIVILIFLYLNERSKKTDSVVVQPTITVLPGEEKLTSSTKVKDIKQAIYTLDSILEKIP